MNYKLSKSVFIEPYSDKYLVYAPLKQLAFLLNKESAEFILRLNEGAFKVSDEKEGQLLEFFKRHELFTELTTNGENKNSLSNAFLPTSLYLLLTSNCNLRCIYCYSSAGETNINLPLKIAKSAIDIIVANALTTSNTPKLRFHGGGEPTLRWKELTFLTEYFRNQTNRIAFKSIVGLNTNGILSEKKLKWISDNIDVITLSLDGIGSAHDLQRPMKGGGGTFLKVWKSMRFLYNERKKFSVRVTITKNNFHQMKEIVESLSEFEINGIEFEPLTICGRVYYENIAAPSTDQYIMGYKSAFEAAKLKGITIIYSGVRLGNISNTFCGAAGKNFAITPSGHATFCHRVSNPADPGSSHFFYGDYSAELNTFVFDYEKIRLMKELTFESSLACKDCFVKWNCGGGCYAQNFAEHGSLLLEKPCDRCYITKGVAAFQIAEKLKIKNL